MVKIILNGYEVKCEEGQTLLEVAKWYGIDIPTLCYNEGLSPYGACRLCIVEVGNGNSSRLVTSCTYPAKEGINVRTHSKQVVEARKIILELLLARCPNSKKLQDLASKLGVNKIRFKMKNEDCILCGLCVRMCEEQMMSGAIGFSHRGIIREVSNPYHKKSDICRECGACMYICPVVEVQCSGYKEKGELCNRCLGFEPTCLTKYDDVKCFVNSCGTCVR